MKHWSGSNQPIVGRPSIPKNRWRTSSRNFGNRPARPVQTPAAEKQSPASAKLNTKRPPAEVPSTRIFGDIPATRPNGLKPELGSASKASLAPPSTNIRLSSDEVEGIVADTRETVQAYRVLAERLTRSSDRVDEVLVSLDELLGSGEAEGVMSDASQTLESYRVLAERLTESTGRLDSVLERADGLLGSDQIEQVVTEANQAMQAIRATAENLNARVGPITAGLERFSSQGLREVETLIRDSRRAINRIEQAITSFERNPQRIITGGEGEVRQFDGRQRR